MGYNLTPNKLFISINGLNKAGSLEAQYKLKFWKKPPKQEIPNTSLKVKRLT